MNSLTAEKVRHLFSYDPATGLLVRRVTLLRSDTGKPVRGGEAGRVAGVLSKSDGYVRVSVDGRVYQAHRLIWLHVTGEWPNGEVDHVDGVRHNNRWANLRNATVQQNRMNTVGQRSRKGPYPGVYEHSRTKGSFVAQIKHNRKVHYLGVFPTPELARDARVAAEKRFFGGFAGHLRDEIL